MIFICILVFIRKRKLTYQDLKKKKNLLSTEISEFITQSFIHYTIEQYNS